MKNIAILGSTGSIGTQALNVIRRHRDRFAVEVLTAGGNAALLVQQAREFDPNTVVIADKNKYPLVKEALADTDIKVFVGEESICDIMEMSTIDMVLGAIVGFAGLRPIMHAIMNGKNVALANKESMVVAGALVTKAAAEHRVAILPVDSEHSAIFQSLVGEAGVLPQGPYGNEIDKILLTASGGPFLGKKREELEHATLEQALKHPNWKMGCKVTIDSASLMNKGLEVIEAKWLFGVDAKKIEVWVHPQSVVHSMVQYRDGSIKAQMGTATMETPIQYALTFPERIESHIPRFSFLDHPQLTFLPPDTDTFRCLPLAYNAIEKGGNMPCIMNAANEVAVQRFIGGKLPFLGIADFVANTMAKATFLPHPTLDDLFATDRAVREAL